MQREKDYDVIVVGAGFGGIYATHHFANEGLKVLCLEKGEEIGGVWHHNRYPGARVDGDSIDYCFHFSSELYRDWRWSERYAGQDEILRYLNFVVDRLGVRDSIRVRTPLTGAEWRPDEQRYHVTAGEDLRLTTRFLVMATGNLTEPRTPTLIGLEDFKGEVRRTSRWPREPVRIAGRRIGVIGTGSSGVQSITAMAPDAEHLYVFQRTAHYSVPARNGPLDAARYEAVAADVPAARARWLGSGLFDAREHEEDSRPRPASAYSQAVQQARLEEQWEFGGQGMHLVFIDQTTDIDSNTVVADFVRNKIRGTVKDTALAEKLCPKYPFGTRRLIIDTGYYEVYNRENVSLVDISENPIERITETGIQTANGHYEIDLLVLALGFNAFRGSLDEANIRNEKGQSPTSRWDRGPRTLLGLMTAGFPNLFTLTGPGSPATVGHLVLLNEYHATWVSDLIRHMDAHGYATAEADEGAEERWTSHVTELAQPLLRLQGNDYMVHRNEDGSRAFIPYVGGMGRYIEAADLVRARGFDGLHFKPATSPSIRVPRTSATLADN